MDSDFDNYQAVETSEVSQSAFFELFVEEVRDICWTESHTDQTLKKWEEIAQSNQLKKIIHDNRAEIGDRINRIDTIFMLMDEVHQARACFAVSNLIEESDDLISETEDYSATRDAAILLSFQKLKYQSIAMYSNLQLMAEALSFHQVESLFKISLEEEKHIIDQLHQLAQNGLYHLASQESVFS